MAQSGLMECVGPLALLEGAEWLDRMHDKAGVSLLSRRPCLQSWADAFPSWEPWILALVEDCEVRAVAPLARRRRRWGVEVVSVGDSALAESPVAACDDAAVAALVAGLVDALQALGCPWMLRLPQLPATSALAAALVAQLSTTVVFAGGPRPVLRFADDRPPKRWLTRNTGSALAKAVNRVSREGHHLEMGWVEPWARIKDVLPELVMVHRARDLELRGVTLLDDAQEAQFYHEVIQRHAGHWRLLTVRIDQSLAGYALCLKDGSSLRVWDNRVAPRWGRYSAGLIANTEIVLRAATDRSVALVDWGCGEQRYKTSLSSEVIGAEVLIAWSSPVLRAALACRNKLAARTPRRCESFGLAGGR
jgi:CelD/BcsL family acetyltransferase involved in cellulose biosynthesis